MSILNSLSRWGQFVPLKQPPFTPSNKTYSIVRVIRGRSLKPHIQKLERNNFALRRIDPLARGASEGTRIDLERVDYWVRQGAQMSDRVKKVVKDYRKATAGTTNEEAA